MMHPSLHKLLLVLLFNFAAGQQSYYNGQSSSPSVSPSSSSSNYQPYGVAPTSYSSSNSYHGQQPQSSYGLTSHRQQQSPGQNYNSDYHHPTTSQSSQHFSYAPAPSQGQSQSQYGFSAQQQPQPSAIPYGNSPPAPPSNVQSPQAQYNSQYNVAPSQQAPVSPSAFAQTQPQPQMYGNQQQQQQGQFSNRQLGPFPPQGPYRPNPNMAMNAPPTTLSTSFAGHAGPTPTGPGGMNPHQFSSRRGPFDGMISRVKEWMPSASKNRGKPPYSAGMGEMNRLPKPPKYPLYDMPSLGMATPPPPPLMSPMAQMPTNLYSSFAHPPSTSHVPQRGGRPSSPPSSSLGSGPPPRRVKNGGGGGALGGLGGSSGKKNRRRNRPAPPPAAPSSKFRSTKRGQRPRGKPSSTSNRNTYAPKPVNDGFDHPMASNVAPVNSPPLGRPLGYDEYMKRPSHSFTDDPWNFDPNAQSYNEGMNTHAMKYNYDPLGMNALDTSLQTHLDENKMSYPGDIMNMESIKEAPKPLSSQLGGWDLPPSSYRNNNNQNSNQNSYSNHHRDSTGTGGFSRFDDQHEGGSSLSSSSITFEDIAPSSTTKNSFNQYDPVTEASILKAESLNPLDIISSQGGGIEFDLDSLNKGSSNNNNNNHNSNSDSYADYKLSDHYSPSDDAQTDHSQDSYSTNGDSYSSYSHSNSPRNRQNSQDYDQYSNSYSNGYSNDRDYGTRQIRANRPRATSHQNRQLQQRHNYSPNSYSSSNSASSHSHNKYSNNISSASSTHPITSSSSTASEGMGLFHDFIKDPTPGYGKARARHSLYKALLS